MPLIVSVPPGRTAERRYILNTLLGDRLGQEWQLRQAEGGGAGDPVSPAPGTVRITVESSPLAVVLPDVLFATPEADWLTQASLPATPLATVPGPGGEPIPVIYGGVPAAGGDDVAIPVDVFGSAFFMLSRYEEAVLPDRDEHDRFPAAASLAQRAGFLETPVVDAYVELLWAALQRCWPGLRRPRTDYRVLLTHDVDDPISTFGRSRIGRARQLAADVALRRAPGLAVRRARALLLDGPDHAHDPNNTFSQLLTVSERAGLRSAFYFQSHARRAPEAGANYALDHPFISRLIQRVHRRGHEVGYHAGFGTYRSAERTATEARRLRTSAERLGVDQPRWGGRQHFLQWSAPETWRNWSDAGLDYDCTLAFADAVGFRTGTCHEFGAFDVRTSTPLPLREHPFQIMDVTLFGYQAKAPDQAMETVLRIADQCRRYHGAVGVLWHNDSHLRTRGEQRWYTDMVAALTG